MDLRILDYMAAGLIYRNKSRKMMALPSCNPLSSDHTEECPRCIAFHEATMAAAKVLEEAKKL